MYVQCVWAGDTEEREDRQRGRIREVRTEAERTRQKDGETKGQQTDQMEERD